MRFLIALGLASALTLAAGSAAEARQGCGNGFHRGPYGHCVPNAGRQAAWVVGQYYPGHGYWYNNRWYHHRYRSHDGWGYR